jgi:hypothetical protein
MARGNQRELARAKAAKKAGTDKGRQDDGLTPQQRNERLVKLSWRLTMILRDKKALEEKAKKKADQKAAQK